VTGIRKSPGPAYWDKSFGDKGSWYAPAGTDLSALSRWMPGQGNSVVASPEESARDEFSRALREAGLQVSGPPVMDGEWHRVPVEADAKGKTSGSYRGHMDGKPAGQITNWKTNYDQDWKAGKSLEQVSAEDRARSLFPGGE
jgi:putative DNA primase/helicase